MTNVFLYCPVISPTATALAEALGATRLRRFDGLNFWEKGKMVTLPTDSIVINWGGRFPELEDVRVLNASNRYWGKYMEWYRWVDANLRVPPIWHGASLPRSLTVDMSRKWIPRRKFHKPCQDLLDPPKSPTFYTNLIPVDHEYKIHVFNGRCIRSGEKRIRTGFELATSDEEWFKYHTERKLAHPWWKHFQTGWVPNYEAFTANATMRKTAILALAALELDFGAVDIGIYQGNYYILGVNRDPWLDTAGITRYAKLIQKWIASPNEKEPEEPEAPAVPVEAPAPNLAPPAPRENTVEPTPAAAAAREADAIWRMMRQRPQAIAPPQPRANRYQVNARAPHIRLMPEDDHAPAVPIQLDEAEAALNAQDVVAWFDPQVLRNAER